VQSLPVRTNHGRSKYKLVQIIIVCYTYVTTCLIHFYPKEASNCKSNESYSPIEEAKGSNSVLLVGGPCGYQISIFKRNQK